MRGGVAGSQGDGAIGVRDAGGTFGRGPEECIPGAFIRTNDFPRIAVDRGNGNVYVTWQDYRTGAFDIQLAQSTDGGLTWTEAKSPVNPDKGKDHYMPAIDVVPPAPPLPHPGALSAP